MIDARSKKMVEKAKKKDGGGNSPDVGARLNSVAKTYAKNHEQAKQDQIDGIKAAANPAIHERSAQVVRTGVISERLYNGHTESSKQIQDREEPRIIWPAAGRVEAHKINKEGLGL